MMSSNEKEQNALVIQAIDDNRVLHNHSNFPQQYPCAFNWLL